MQNLRKNKNKVITTQMMNLTNEEAIDTETCDEMNRGCKGKPNNMYNNNNCGKQTCMNVNLVTITFMTMTNV